MLQGLFTDGAVPKGSCFAKLQRAGMIKAEGWKDTFVFAAGLASRFVYRIIVDL